MTKQNNIFLATLDALHKSGVFEDIILIGSWCHHFYRVYFDNAPEIPVVRTMDIDFLIPNPAKIHKDINIPEILRTLDFIPTYSYTTGYTKYEHPELELEFLTPELGRGKNKPYELPKLHINAQGLRYLNLLQSNVLKIKYKHMMIQLPEPAAYVLHKFIIFERRKEKSKKERDLLAAKDIGEFLLQNKTQRKKLLEIFHSLPLKWQKTIIKNIKTHSEPLFDFLSKKEIL